MSELDKLRDEIDKIDSELLKLFERRMEICREICEVKIKEDIPVYNAKREEEVIKKISSKVNNKELNQYAQRFFKEIMSISKKLQYKCIEDMEEKL